MHSTSLRLITLGFSSFIIAIVPFKQLVRAQSTPPSGVTIPPNTPERIEETIPKPTQTPLPTTPELAKPPLQVPTNTPKPSTTPSNKLINLKQIEILDSTVLRDEIIQLSEKFVHENCSKQPCFVSLEDLLQLRSAITQLYIDNGYVTSGAFIPVNQRLESGTVEIQVVEGELERIEISGLNRLQQNYIRSRLAPFTKPPLNQKRLLEALQLLQLNPLIQKVDGRLDSGSTPGRNIWKVQLKEAPAFNAGIVIDNNQSPTIGSEQGSAFATYNNLLGIGDQFTAQYGLTKGLDLYNLGYRIPINALDGTFNIGYSNNDSQIVENQFADLGIRSDSKTFTFGLRQPVVKKPDTEFALGLSLDLRRSQTFLLDDIPYSFSEGPEKGKSRVTVIRFSQEWLRRNATQIFAARSQFSFGIDAFDATINNTGTDGRFFAWLVQLQGVQQLSPSGTLMLVKLNAQLTPDALLPLEEISLGGVDTVRGYRQNELVTDNGINASVELRFPVTSDKSLQIRPFFDIGTVWNNRGKNLDSKTIAGLGLGLTWQPQSNLSLQIDYGIPLIPVEDQGNSLQENGLYFSLRYQPL